MRQNQLPLSRPAANAGKLPGGALTGVARSHGGELDRILPLIPEFDRVPFGSGAAAHNEFLDAIVRRGNPEQGYTAVPVGVVSKRYCLVPHVEVAEPGPPHAKTMTPTRRVAGSPARAGTAYDACQILAWIAKDRREAQERVDWMLQIPGLMQGMLGRG